MNTPLKDVPGTILKNLLEREAELRMSGAQESAELIASLRERLRDWLEVRQALLTIFN